MGISSTPSTDMQNFSESAGLDFDFRSSSNPFRSDSIRARAVEWSVSSFSNRSRRALSIRIGLGWAKSHVITTGQCPVMRYHHGLMQAILGDRVQIAKAVNATVITLDDAPQGYEHFDSGVARKFVLNPNELIAA